MPAKQDKMSLESLNFFEEGSPFLAHPLLTAARTAQEVDFVESELALSPGARLLDVGCGFGRHSIELARRGYDVVGLDPSATMVRAARARAARARATDSGVRVDFLQEQGQNFVTKIPFEGAICLFTSLGQITPAGENSGLVGRVYEALRPGSRFMVEVPQRATAVRQLKPADRFGDGERTTEVTRYYDAESQTISEIFHLVSPEESRCYHLRYRLYDRPALLALLTQAGFTIQATYGDYAGTPLDDEHAIMVVVGQKG